MWKPQLEGVKELIDLFRDSKSSNNLKQKEIYTKIKDYSTHKEFSNYLVFILNSEECETQIRQIAGLTLKGIMEREFDNFNHEFFKDNILNCYLDQNLTIRKTISNLINAFLRQGGMELWPGILEFLKNNLNSDTGVEMSLETLNIIIEDSGQYLEEKYSNFLEGLIPKIIEFLYNTGLIQLKDRNEQLTILVLTTLNTLLENCENIMSESIDSVSRVLLNLIDSKTNEIRYRIGQCYLVMIRLKKDFLYENAKNIFLFHMENLQTEEYKTNFISAEFVLFMIEDEEEILKSQVVVEQLHTNLEKVVTCTLFYMKLTANDISGLDNRSSTVKSNEEEEEEETEGYNPNWTLRKCCSKLIDKLSNLFPQEVFEIIKPVLENEIQSNEWIVKERSILCLGAIGVGSYPYLKHYLSNLIAFLIKELQHPNKLVRAISCWTLSRFTKFILADNLSDNSNDMFKDYLGEILKKFLDTEVMVQEAALTAFSSMVISHKKKLEPYLYDIFKIVVSAFNKYTGTSLLTLYDIISLLTENYEDHFKNLELISDVVNCVCKRWYDMIKAGDYKHICPVFEILCAIVKVSGEKMKEYFNHFFGGSMIIMETNYENLDKELLSKCLNMMSILCNTFPAQIKQHQSKGKILDCIFKLLETNDNFLKHYVIALIGDLSKADETILLSQFRPLMNVIVDSMNIPNDTNMEKVSVCNNACWTAGILALTYPNQTVIYVKDLMSKIIEILKLPKLNKSLAQNVSICIGRLALIDPVTISHFLDNILKQFCLSLRLINDSQEKREAFNGLCNAIVKNPTGVMNYFAFFCDAICQYDNAPEELEQLFQFLIQSYKNTLKEKWVEYFTLFPDKLKIKMTVRFNI